LTQKLRRKTSDSRLKASPKIGDPMLDHR